MNKEMSYIDIAKKLKKKPNAVFMMQKRALDKAKKLLAQRGYKLEDFFKE
jgi:hypothetical protein